MIRGSAASVVVAVKQPDLGPDTRLQPLSALRVRDGRERRLFWREAKAAFNDRKDSSRTQWSSFADVYVRLASDI